MPAHTPHFATAAVHAPAPVLPATPRATPIYLTAGFTFADFDEAANHFGTGDGFGYTRTGNPGIRQVEQHLAALESGVDALLVASGQAATSTAILAVAGAGDHIVASTHIYEGSRGLFLDGLARLGIETTFVSNTADAAEWRAAARPNTRAFFAESIANARNDILDTAAIAAVSDDLGIPLILDNTMATPALYRPLEHGAAIVVHSASKFLAGHGSVLGGVIVDGGRFREDSWGANFPHLTATPHGPSFAERFGGAAILGYLRESVAPRFGPSPSPLNAFLIGQGIETLALRVERQSQNALTVARWLSEHPAVAGVDYVGLPSHPHHALAERYLPDGYGSVFTVTLRGGEQAARTVVNTVSLITHMTHLGDVRTLVLHPQTTSHVHRSAEECRALGVYPGTLRLSVGIENAADLIADLSAALDTLGAS